jgi:hypothetical protein
MDLQEIRLDWNGSGKRQMEGCCEQKDEPVGLIKCGEFHG